MAWARFRVDEAVGAWWLGLFNLWESRLQSRVPGWHMKSGVSASGA